MRELLGELRGRARWVVLGCAVCQMGLGFAYGMGGLAPDILAEFGWSRALYSSGQAPQGWVIALASPAVGFGVARFGGRRVLALGAITMGVAYGLIAGMQAWWQLFLGWSLVGLGVALLGDIATGAVVTQWVRRRRGLLLGAVYTGSNLGGWIASRGMAAIADTWSWRHAVAAIAVAAFALLLPAAWLAVHDRAGDAPAPGPAGQPGAPDPADDPSLPVAAALRTRSFWVLAAGLFGFWIYLYAVLGHLVLALVDAGLERQAAVSHLSNAVLMGLFSKVVFGLVADRLHPKASLLLDYGLLALSSFFLVAASTGAAGPTWTFVLLFGFSYAARDVVTPLIVVHCFGPRSLAQIYGLLMLTILPGSSLGPVLPGWAHDRTGSYELAFTGLAVCNALTWLLLLAVRDERRGAER